MLTKMLEKKEDSFHPQMLKLVVPLIIQNMLSAAVGSADVIMLNYVDQNSLAAVSLAAQFSNVLFSVYYGIGTGLTMLCAQYYGKKDYEAIRYVQGIALRFSLLISALLSALAFFIPDSLMRIFTNDAALISLGSDYLRVMSITYLCWSIIEVYLFTLRSIGRVAINTILNVTAFTLNIILNAVFIFGLFGMPKLGVFGVAIATALSRAIELIGCILVSVFSKDIKLDFRYIFKKNPLLLKDFVKMTLPALGNDVIWGIAFSLYSAILGHLGSDVVAANSIVIVVRNFGTVFCYGIASAGGILLGNVLGENKLELADTYASKILKLTILFGVLGGVLVLLASPFVLRYAALSDLAMHYLKYMLLINSYYITGTAVNTTLIAGVFRAGGDSRFGFICDTIDMWVYAIPLGLFSAFVLKLPVLWVYFLLCTDEFVKWPWVFSHYKSKKWLKNITRDNLFEEA